MNIINSEAKGSWWRFNRQSDSPKDEIKLDVFKAWIDHGKRASEETYQYIVVPATSVEKLEENISKGSVKILVNTPEIQAVRHDKLKMCQAVFYQAGEVQVTDKIKLGSQTPGIVILKAEGEGISEITVSDPNRELGKMLLSVSAKIEKVVENYTAVWNEKEKLTNITIDLPKGHYAGSSVTIKL